MAVTSAAGAPSPSICKMGSPGTRWISRKTTETTSQITGRAYAARVRRLRRIVTDLNDLDVVSNQLANYFCIGHDFSRAAGALIQAEPDALTQIDFAQA